MLAVAALGEDELCSKEIYKPGAHPSVSDPGTGGPSGNCETINATILLHMIASTEL